MILDSSAVVALFLKEPEREVFLNRIGAAPTVGIGAPTLVETGILLSSRLGEGAASRLARVLDHAGILTIPFEPPHWEVAVDAWWRFGKGRHQAGLNFGDCLAYATARLAGRPLLCKGDDFAKTDLDLVR